MRRFIIFSVILFLTLLIGGGMAFFFSVQQVIRENKGIELSQHLEIQRINLETKVNSEIALVLNMANSHLQTHASILSGIFWLFLFLR